VVYAIPDTPIHCERLDMSGWIKLHRDIRKHWIFQRSDYLLFWVDLLMMANHKKKTWLFNDRLIEIKRGEVVTSTVNLSKRWNCSRNKIRHFIELLEKDAMVEHKKDRGYTHLSICNYETYQDKGTGEGHQKDRQGTGKGQARDTTKECKELKNVKNIYIPKNNQLNEIEESLNDLQDQFKNRNVKAEFQHFKDYCEANGKKYKNYLAAFRNWLRNENYRTEKDAPIVEKQIIIACPNGHVKRKSKRGINAVCPTCYEQLIDQDKLQLERAIA